MANLNLSNFIVDRVISGVAYNKDKDGNEYPVVKMDQCQNTSITCGSESTDIVDNVGSPIMTLYRAKTCEISGENAILDFGITAMQMGTDKKVADADNKVIAPAQELFDAKATYQLKHVPLVAPAFVYVLNNDSSLGDKFAKGTAAKFDTKEFAYDAGTHTITLPVAEGEIPAGTQMFVSYEYESDAAVEVINSAKNFPKSCKLVLRVLGYNPCNKENKLGAYIIFDSFQMSPDFDLSLNAGEAQSWSGKATQDYCSKDRALMRIVVVDDEDDTF